MSANIDKSNTDSKSEENENSENKSPNQNASRESERSIKISKKNSLVSRLYQPTASSAAKSAKTSNAPSSRNTTPTLPRKFPNRANTTPIAKVPVLSIGKPTRSEIKSQIGQPRNQTTKKFNLVATSSFINQDKVDTPTDWDASAIVPIEGMETQPNDQRTIRSNFVFNFDSSKLSKARNGSASSDNSSRRGPLRAFSNNSFILSEMQGNLSNGGASNQNSFENKRVNPKVLHSNSSTGYGSSEEPSDLNVEEIFDEYIMSELIKAKAKSCHKELSEKVDNEVASAWLVLEQARAEYLQLLGLTQKVTKLMKLSDDLDIDINELTSACEINKHHIENADRLAKGLLLSRHHLRVAGLRLNAQSSSKSLTKALEQNPIEISKSTLHDESLSVKSMSKDVSDVLSLYDDCSKLTQTAAKLQDESDSLQLSLNQSKVCMGSTLAKIQDSYKVPQRPLVKLIDI